MKILVAGDFCPNYRVAELFKRDMYQEVLGDVKVILEQIDYSIVNLECPVCYGNEKKIKKCGPNLHCTDKGLKALDWVGFDGVTLANNHIMDYGKEGLHNTIECCYKYALDYVGVGDNINESSNILYKEICGKVFAFINCCEHEFSIATHQRHGANPLSPIRQYNSIKDAKTKADEVIVIVHGGHEHYQLPSIRMKECYRFLIDAGASAVINHHQHCYSGYEVYKGKPIFYGIGNFCFDWEQKRPDTWNYGYMVVLEYESDKLGFDIIPYVQCKDKPMVKIEEKIFFEEKINFLNEIINDEEQLREKESEYYKSCLLEMNLILEPIGNRLIQALQIRKILPRYFFSTKYMLRLYNYLMCESHKDKINYYLETRIEEKVLS